MFAPLVTLVGNMPLKSKVFYYLSPAPQAEPQAVGFSSGLSPEPQAEPQAVGLSPAPQADEGAASLAFLLHAYKFESAIS